MIGEFVVVVELCVLRQTTNHHLRSLQALQTHHNAIEQQHTNRNFLAQIMLELFHFHSHRYIHHGTRLGEFSMLVTADPSELITD